MGGQSFNVQTDGRGTPAKALRADAKLVDLVQHLFLQIGVEGVGVMGVQRTHNGLFGQQGGLVKGTADAHADDDGGAGVGAGGFYCFQNKVLDALQTGRGFEHPNGTHVLTAKALGTQSDLYPVAGHDLGVEHGGGVVAGVAAADRILHHGFAQIAVGVAAADPVEADEVWGMMRFRKSKQILDI